MTEYVVTEIPLPWAHPWGVVVRLEYPEDRPKVVDLVFANGWKTTETKGTRYSLDEEHGYWDLATTTPDSSP